MTIFRVLSIMQTFDIAESAVRRHVTRTTVHVRRARFTHICSLALLAISLFFVAGCGDGNDNRDSAGGDANAESEEIMVFAAASLRDAMEEIGKQFEQETGSKVLFNFAGSNDLARQIVSSTTADVYLSANQTWMDTVENAGRIVPGSRHDLLSNSLVVVGNSRMTATVSDPCELRSLNFEHLALGDPNAVPAGTYAKKWLSDVQCGSGTLWEAVEGKVSPAPDVRAALGLVLADPKIIGIVYKTDQRMFADKTTIILEVPHESGPRIRYSVAQIAEGPAPNGGKRFLEYLSGGNAAEIFQRLGFTIVMNQP